MQQATRLRGILLILEDVSIQRPHKTVRLTYPLHMNTKHRALKPSIFVARFGARLVDAAQGYPIVDIGCGSGRNAIVAARMGCTVICLDKDMSRLRIDCLDPATRERLKVLQLDVLDEPWPFGANSLGGAIIVDFLPWPLFSALSESIIPDGFVLLETVSGRGGNFHELPLEGQLESIFKPAFVMDTYIEKPIRPRASCAVTVKMLARRKA